jgi:hypothetical protein
MPVGTSKKEGGTEIEWDTSADDDVNLLGGNISIIKNTGTLIDAIKEVGLAVNAERTKRMLLSCHQSAGYNHSIKLADRFSENVAQFKYGERQ